MKVLLVANYEGDRQESMNRFAQLLAAGLEASGIQVSVLRPPVRIGGGGLFSKWRAYVDKFILFRSMIRRASAAADLVHICDHSNAMYVELLRKPTVVTCHDLLAVRGALGENTDCPASPLGKVLQKWIGRGLSRAHALVCVSHATSADVERIIVRNGRPKTQVVHTGLSYPYRRLSVEETDARIAASQVRLPGVFLLHVGSSLRRKNREAVLRTLARLHPDKVAGVVFAGAPLNESQRALAVQLGVRERTVEVIGPSNELLEALYNRAHCLLFPSRFEGFGWPIIEAQACGCPVTCGNGTSLPEIAGDGAIIVDPDDDQKLAEAVTELLAPARRAELIAQGTANVARFSVSQMVQEYIAVYREALKQ